VYCVGRHAAGNFRSTSASNRRRTPTLPPLVLPQYADEHRAPHRCARSSPGRRMRALPVFASTSVKVDQGLGSQSPGPFHHENGESPSPVQSRWRQSLDDERVVVEPVERDPLGHEGGLAGGDVYHEDLVRRTPRSRTLKHPSQSRSRSMFTRSGYSGSLRGHGAVSGPDGKQLPTD
jgi:hypothetical protein